MWYVGWVVACVTSSVSSPAVNWQMKYPSSVRLSTVDPVTGCEAHADSVSTTACAVSVPGAAFAGSVPALLTVGALSYVTFAVWVSACPAGSQRLLVILETREAVVPEQAIVAAVEVQGTSTYPV